MAARVDPAGRDNPEDLVVAVGLIPNLIGAATAVTAGTAATAVLVDRVRAGIR